MPDDIARTAAQTGLVCGYSVDASGEMSTVGWTDMDQVLLVEDTLVWLHFDQSDPAARAWIDGCSHIPDAAKAMLLGSDQHMRIEAAGSGLSGVVGDLHHEFARKPDRLDVLRLYLDNRCLISARREPLAAIEKLRSSIGEGLKVERPIALVTQFLHHVTDTLGDVILELTDNVDTLEEAVLGGSDEQPGEELSRIRTRGSTAAPPHGAATARPDRPTVTAAVLDRRHGRSEAPERHRTARRARA